MDSATGWAPDEGRGDSYGIDRPLGPARIASTVMPARQPDEQSAFHYRTEGETRLHKLASKAPALRTVAAQLPDVDVCFVRMTAKNGLSVRVPPRAVPDALFLDQGDFAALKAGLGVPGLDEALRMLKAYAARN